MIDDPQAARRLARAISSDVVLYNGDAVRAAPPADRATILREPVSEARQLYISRVIPELLPIFDEEITRFCEQLESGPLSFDAPMPAPHVHPPVERAERMREPEPVGGGGGLNVVLVALALVAIAGLAGWFLLQR